MNFKVGVVTHYFDKIKVAIVELNGQLSVGDTIKFVRGGEDMFTQTVTSLQVEHNKVETAAGGEIVGLKVQEGVKAGAEIYKI